MVMSSREVLNYLKKNLDYWDCPFLPRLCTASLVEELTPDGLVQIKDYNGNVILVLSRDAYESIIPTGYREKNINVN